MKRHLFTCFLCVLLTAGMNRSKAQTPFNPVTYSGWLSTPNNYFGNLPAGSGLTFNQPYRGAGNQFSTSTDGLNSGQWQNASAADAIAANRYFGFSIVSNSTTSFQVDSLLLILGRTAAGPDSCMLQYKSSATGYNFVPVTNSIYTLLNPTTNPTTSIRILPATSLLVGPSDSLVFRLVAWHGSSSLGKMRIINNTAVYGSSSVVISSSISAPSIQTTDALCVSSVMGDSVQVTFSSTGTFNSGNAYSLELSDASGSFAAPVAIGSVNSQLNSGTIQGFVPAGTPNASYRLRVRSSNPPINGMDTTSLLVHPGIVLSAVIHQPNCPDSLGAIDLIVSGGSGTLQYDWSNGQTTQDIVNLPAGNVDVLVTDGVGCSADSSFQISSIPAFNVIETITNALCHSGNEGEITVGINGGTAPYDVTWSGNGISQTGLTASNLPTGNYNLTISDAHNCMYTSGYTVTQPDAIDADETVQQVNCYGENNGEITVVITGGTVPYTAVWSGNGINQSGLSAANLSSGNYNLTITDANNCTYTSIYTITQPAPIAVSATINHAVCATCNGTIALTVSGGHSPYAFDWSNNATASQILGVPGTYCVEISDAHNCAADSCFVISSTAGMNEYASLKFTVFPNPASDVFHIELPEGLTDTSKEVRISNLFGKEVYRSVISGEMQQVEIPVNSWSNGTYIYSFIIVDNETIHSGRIIVNH